MDTIKLLNERAASYGALRQSSLTAVAMDCAAVELAAANAQVEELTAELASLKAREVGYVQAMDAMGDELAASKERERETLAVLQTAHESEAALVRQKNALIHVVMWISANYENGEINHKDFRVRAKNLADDALLGDPV